MRIRGRRVGIRNTVRFVILSILNIIEPRARWIAQLFEEWREQIEAETLAEDALDEFRDVCLGLGMSPPTLNPRRKRELIQMIVSQDYRPRPENIFPLAAPDYFPDEPSHKVDARTAVALCQVIDQEENSAQKHPLKKAVERVISDYNFNEIGPEERDILRAVEDCILTKNTETSTNIFEGELDRPPRDVVEIFLQEYTVETFALYLLRHKERVNDLRSTLAHLIREGRLSVGNLTVDVINSKLSEVEKDLERAKRVYSGYFLFSHQLLNSGMNSTERLFSRFPMTIWIKGTEVRGQGQSGYQLKPAFHIVLSDTEHTSAQEFLEDAIQPILPPRNSWNPHSMVAVVPFHAAEEFVSIPSQETLQREAKNEQAQFAEVLLKILCHNVVVLIHEMKESETDPGFLSDTVENASALI